MSFLVPILNLTHSTVSEIRIHDTRYLRKLYLYKCFTRLQKKQKQKKKKKRKMPNLKIRFLRIINELSEPPLVWKNY